MVIVFIIWIKYNEDIKVHGNVNNLFKWEYLHKNKINDYYLGLRIGWDSEIDYH